MPCVDTDADATTKDVSPHHVELLHDAMHAVLSGVLPYYAVATGMAERQMTYFLPRATSRVSVLLHRREGYSPMRQMKILSHSETAVRREAS